jgi:anti-sigma factor RsiW
MSTDPMSELPPELGQHLVRYQAPPGLKRRIGYMVEQQARGAVPAPGWRGLRWRWASLAASFVCGAVLALSVAVYRDTVREEDAVEQQVVAAHLRSLMAAHLTDVASTDQHTVKPWFTGKLDYAPPVIDPAPEGFPLAGGRLDFLQGRPVAALVYRRRGHTINVFVAPATGSVASGTTLAQRQGWQLAAWDQDGMRFHAVSDLSRDELLRFANALQQQR